MKAPLEDDWGCVLIPPNISTENHTPCQLDNFFPKCMMPQHICQSPLVFCWTQGLPSVSLDSLWSLCTHRWDVQCISRQMFCIKYVSDWWIFHVCPSHGQTKEVLCLAARVASFNLAWVKSLLGLGVCVLGTVSRQLQIFPAVTFVDPCYLTQVGSSVLSLVAMLKSSDNFLSRLDCNLVSTPLCWLSFEQISFSVAWNSVSSSFMFKIIASRQRLQHSGAHPAQKLLNILQKVVIVKVE